MRITISHRHRLAVAIAVLALGLLAAPRANAGTYDVQACDAAPGSQNNSWTASASPGMSAYSACPTSGDRFRGLVARNSVTPGRVGWGSNAVMAFSAPSGASLVGMSYVWEFARTGSEWNVGVGSGFELLAGCAAGSTCNPSSIGTSRDTPRWFDLGGRSSVYIGVSCGSFSGCDTTSSGVQQDGYFRARGNLYFAVVTVQDYTQPNLNLTGGGLTSGGWVRDNQAVTFDSSDNVGIFATLFYVDGQLRHDNNERGCDFTQPVPCSNVAGGRYSIATSELSDGPHSFTVQSVDTASNPTSATRTFYVDNHAPARPAVTVDGGEDWRQGNDFSVRWATPAGQSAPIVRAHYRLCSTDPAPVCSTGSRDGAGIEQISGLSVPQPGDYTLRVWLEDQAGNVNSESSSDAVHLRFDNVAPGRAEPERRNGWLNAREAAEFDQFISLADGALRPVSGVRGYSITTDGTHPDGTPELTGDTYRINDLPQGVTTVKARAISGSGVPSNEIGSTEVRVDRTAPSATADGAPESGQWMRSGVTLRLSGNDQPGLSGMDPAPPDQPAQAGGYLVHRIDGGETSITRGGAGEAHVSEDGEHTVSYQAFDTAGNPSTERSVSFKIDQTAPELVAFEAQDPIDPRRVVVAASDRTSGLGAGSIEMRRAGSSEWSALSTERQSDRFAAIVNDDELAAGRYEFRARVQDVAGNEAMSDRRRDGSLMLLQAPFRIETQVTAGIVKPKKKTKKKRAKPAEQLVGALKLPFGKKALIRGAVKTAGGDPLADAIVDVFSEHRSVGARPERVGTVRTDRAGRFKYSAPAGPSRKLRFRYEGTTSLASAEAEVTVNVAASSKIRVNKRRARNGQTVKFSGQLRGKPIANRKLIDLQAYYRGKWRTFATPRTDKKGRWKFSYRFGATRGRVVYKFRARIRREATYPYELGYSRQVKVTVRGR